MIRMDEQGRQIAEKGLPSKVRLWNRGDKTYDQTVDGERIVIEPGQYKELPRRRAIAVRGHFPGRGIIVRLDIDPILDKYDEPEKIIPTTDPSKAKIYTCPICESEYGVKEDALSCARSHRRTRGPGRKHTTVKAGTNDTNAGDNEV